MRTHSKADMGGHAFRMQTPVHKLIHIPFFFAAILTITEILLVWVVFPHGRGVAFSGIGLIRGCRHWDILWRLALYVEILIVGGKNRGGVFWKFEFWVLSGGVFVVEEIPGCGVLGSRDAIVMEGGAGGDEDGVDAERFPACVGDGSGHLHPRERPRIAQRGAFACAGALPLHDWQWLQCSRCDLMELHSVRLVQPHGFRSAHARPSHKQVCLLPHLPVFVKVKISFDFLSRLCWWLTRLSLFFSVSDFWMCRILPIRHQQPEMYKMYLDLTSTYAFCLSSTKVMPCRDRWLNNLLLIASKGIYTQSRVVYTHSLASEWGLE